VEQIRARQLFIPHSLGTFPSLRLIRLLHSSPIMFSLYCLFIPLLFFSSPCSALDSGIVEFDLVFPRNDTYAPAEAMPIIFAFQNSKLADDLQSLLFWSVHQVVDSNNSSIHGKGTGGVLENQPGSSFFNNGTSFYTTVILDTVNIEGVWKFQWNVNVENCTGLQNDLDTGTYDGVFELPPSLIFTTKAGAPLPDLQAASGEPSCATANQSVAFDVVGSMNLTVPDTNGLPTSYTPCAIMTPLPSTVSINPCAPTLDAFGASSISKFVACRYDATQTLISCATPTTSGAIGSYFIPKTILLLVGSVYWIMYNIVN
jgi:hypothetical protein